MKNKRYKNSSDLAKDLGLSKEVGQIAEIKTKLTGEILKVIEKKDLTHQDVADSSGVPRSAVTGIVNGSLQKVSLDRLVRILNAVGKTIDIRVKDGRK